MKTLDETIPVDDTAENRQICTKYCGSCPTFKSNKLSESPPHELFCARGRSLTSSNVKTVSCYCPACEVFTKNKLIIGYFCTKG